MLPNPPAAICFNSLSSPNAICFCQQQNFRSWRLSLLILWNIEENQFHCCLKKLQFLFSTFHDGSHTTTKLTRYEIYRTSLLEIAKREVNLSKIQHSYSLQSYKLMFRHVLLDSQCAMNKRHRKSSVFVHTYHTSNTNTILHHQS